MTKCTRVICQLAYKTATDQCDEYIRIGENTILDVFKSFAYMVEIYSPVYLKRPAKMMLTG